MLTKVDMEVPPVKNLENLKILTWFLCLMTPEKYHYCKWWRCLIGCILYPIYMCIYIYIYIYSICIWSHLSRQDDHKRFPQCFRCGFRAPWGRAAGDSGDVTPWNWSHKRGVHSSRCPGVECTCVELVGSSFWFQTSSSCSWMTGKTWVDFKLEFTLLEALVNGWAMVGGKHW